jgi:hypothetical protein
VSDQPRGRPVPIWVFVVTFVVVALAAGAIGWFIANLRPAPVVVVIPPVATPTVETSPTTPIETSTTVPTTPTVPATATPIPATVKEPCRVTKVTWSASKGYRITVDYVQILTGKAAADAATAAGEESPPPNDYFIVNSSHKLRTFTLPKTASITVLGWGGTDATAKTKIPVGQFMDIMPGGVNPQDDYSTSYYYVTVKAGKTVTKVEMIYFP